MYRILVLTDHTAHTAQNSLYLFCQMLAEDALVQKVCVATRRDTLNSGFFSDSSESTLHTVRVGSDFSYTDEGSAFRDPVKVDIADFDVVLLRLAPPIPQEFLSKLEKVYNADRIINRPSGITVTGSKRFLMEVSELCPPIQILETIEDAVRMSKEYPIVLKPFNAYGGAGILRMADGLVVSEGENIAADPYFGGAGRSWYTAFLGMKFLENVAAGDKRNIVIDGHVIGSTLRLPAEGSWLCNISQGGRSELSMPDADELKIAEALSQRLKQEGIIIYGFDTLVDENGRRVLSEINTTSVGGIVHLERDDSRDVLRGAVEHLIDYIDLEMYG